MGSIVKVLWGTLLAFKTLPGLSHHILDLISCRVFEVICKYCLQYSDLIPLSFVLGFYVNLVVKRWWEMFQSM